jgi:VIT1/CCC1 family predicted Fe2+/Mn2+ transporter
MIKVDHKKILEHAMRNINEAEKWHKRTNVREIVFGFNDGSISLLALLAGVTGGSFAQGHIIAVGVSGVIAGAISMGIGAYISSKSEIEHHRSEINREKIEIEQVPEVEKEEVKILYRNKAPFNDEELNIIVDRITSDKDVWLDVMMKEELGLFEERFESPVKIGLIMLTTFLAGGMVPILPFFLIQTPLNSLMISAILTYSSLFIIGYWKTTFTDRHWIVSGLEMVGIGIVAAVVPYMIGETLLSLILSGPFG